MRILDIQRDEKDNNHRILKKSNSISLKGKDLALESMVAPYRYRARAVRVMSIYSLLCGTVIVKTIFFQNSQNVYVMNSVACMFENTFGRYILYTRMNLKYHESDLLDILLKIQIRKYNMRNIEILQYLSL
jgi:hypothetical protein